ncbi:MAG TPA: hypothetical protein VMB72_01180 [Acidimicrobiales bacterium]|nr:hypothetical protein [Acidimicrobiales bacterium]
MSWDPRQRRQDRRRRVERSDVGEGRRRVARRAGTAAGAAVLVLALGAAAATTSGAASSAAPGAPATAPGPTAAPRPASGDGTPAPVTGAAQARQGILPPAVPAANIDPSPDFLADCSGTAYDDSTGCIDATLQAIANAREVEGLPAMVLPSDWGQLSPQEQVFTVTDLERTVRGLPALSGMAVALDASAADAAAADTDPSPPAGFPWTSWGGNWAAAVGNPLEADYFWMYDDGEGSSNIDCTPTDTSGCWGHRDNILMTLSCQPCVMGVGFAATAWQGDPSWTELLVDSSGPQSLEFTWSQVLPDLPGSPGGTGLAAKAVGLAATPDGAGYWLASADGGVFAFGDAGFYGSMAGQHLGAEVAGIAATPDGRGYWLVASDGGIFAFGDAAFDGSMGGRRLSAPIVGITATPDGHGYWEVASDGGIFAFGDAPFRGSTGGHVLAAPVVSMSAPPSSVAGYWLAAADGGIFSFGVPFHGSMG